MSNPKRTAVSPKTQQSEPRADLTSQTGPWAMVPAWILTMNLTGNEIAVYVALRTFCDRDGLCWPQARTIAERAGGNRSISLVRNAIQKFRKLGLLTTEEVFRKGTRELSHLRFHLVDLDPRAWDVTRRDVSLNGGIPQASDTPHSAEVQVSLSGVSQEHTSDHHTKKDSSAAGASSSSTASAETTDDAKAGKAKKAPKPRTATDRTARIAARKEREREEAVQDICARLGTDLEQAAALCDHLVGEFSPASLARYVESIDNGDLETLLEVATYELDEQRELYRTAADYHGRNIAAFHAGAPKVEVDAVTAMFHDALRAGMVEGELIQRINGAGVPKSARSIADRYAAALRTPRSVAA